MQPTSLYISLKVDQLPRRFSQQPGEMSLSEWQERFEEVTAQQTLRDNEKARLLLDHLTSPAWEEACACQRKRGESMPGW